MDVATKPRIRTKIACEECRKNKRKCDGERPACTLCRKSGRACCYAPEGSRKRKFDETVIRDLENKVRTLESVIESQNKREEVNWNPSETNDHLPAPNQNGHTDHLAPENGGVRSHVAMEELASLMLTMDIEDKGEPSFTISSRKSTLAAHRDPQVNLQKIIESDPRPSDAQSDIREQLLMSFESFNAFHQVIDSDEVGSIIRQDPIAMEGRLDEKFRNSAILSIGASLSSIIGAAELDSQYASYAEEIILQCIREQPSDLVVQGLSLLSWRELQLGNDSMAYNYIAMATGQILHLGLHVTALTVSAKSTGVDDAQFRRRVRSFWAYFSIDRIVTSSLGMNCTMHWQRVKPPSYLRAVIRVASTDDIAHDRFCQLWHLWDSCMDQALAFGWAHLSSSERKDLIVRSHQALKDFYDAVDPQLNLQGDAVAGRAIWVQLAYHTAVLLIHRPFLNEPTGSFTLDFALRSATSAAASISRITRTYRKHPAFKEVLPQIIEYLLSASIIHLLNATSDRTLLGRQSANGLRCCLEALQDMDSKWEVRVQRAILRIRQLAHRWEVVWALPLSLSQPLQPKDLMRDKVQENEREGGAVQSAEILDFELGDGNANSHSFDEYLGDFWNPSQYEGALGQIYDSNIPDNWDLDQLFGNRHFSGGFELVSDTSE